MGGADSFRLAADVPTLDAAVSFYGIAPDESVLARIKAPLAGFYGEDDPRVMPTVRAADMTMKRLGKAYELHVYPGATQAFMRSTVEGQNTAATAAIVMGNAAIPWLEATGLAARLVAVDGAITRVGGWPEPEPDSLHPKTPEPEAPSGVTGSKGRSPTI